MEIKSVTVLESSMTEDTVYLHTGTMAPNGEDLSLTFKAPSMKGLEYVTRKFPGIPITVVNIRTGKVTEIKGS